MPAATYLHASRVVASVDRWTQRPDDLPEQRDQRRIADSWRRCLLDYSLDPGHGHVEVVMESPRLRERRDQMGELFHVAQAEMENLYHQISGSGYAVILTDAEGYVINRVGDPDQARCFADVGLWPGADWSERQAGTNGIGTCLAERRPVTIHRDEHFLSCNAALSCSAAPVRDPHGGLIGVLDASSVSSRDTRESQTHTVALVKMSARVIENSNFLRSFRDQWVLRFHVRPEFVGLLNEGMLACDAAGTLLAANASALVQLGVTASSEVVGRPVNEVLDISPSLLHEAAIGQGHSVWPIRELRQGKCYFATLRAPERRPAGASIPAAKGQIIRPSPAPRDATPSLESLASAGDPQMAYNVRCAGRVMNRNVPILLCGETGSGKEALAAAIHNASARRDKPFVAVNCASIPESLIESELFGYRHGAFTGARRDGMRGKVLQSSGGTLFLDEIGDMPPELQTRLLRVLEQKEVLPLGSEVSLPVELHVISATHRDVTRLVEEGIFREDLYYRLNGITLTLPPLRARGDKESLIRSALAAENDLAEDVGIDYDAFQRLLNHPWPGNIRQLRNCLRTALALCDDGIIRLADLPQEIVNERVRPVAPGSAPAQSPPQAQPESGPEAEGSPLETAEHETLIRELERHRWNITNTAASLGVSRNTLYRKMRKYGISTGQ